jgi:uncharacterized protein (DUF1501 family)
MTRLNLAAGLMLASDFDLQLPDDLEGGNDGLNSIVPFANDVYYQQRPALGIPAAEVLKLNDQQGLHPALAPLRQLYDNGELSIVNSVGFPNPDRSHFRSMDIWQSGSGADQIWNTGWLGRYLDHSCEGKPAYHALEVDDGLSLAMKGAKRNGFAMSNAQRLRQAVKSRKLNSITPPAVPASDNLGYLYKTLTTTTESAAYLFEQSKIHRSQVDYPKDAFGRDLKQVAELITADTATQVYYASLGGFDTHAGQKNRQQRLLKSYAEGVAALVKDLKANGLFNDVLIMTFSEFGRRLKQNASGGTDHGTANNVLFMGGQLKKAGFYNEAPELVNLKNANLIHKIDFRRCYASAASSLKLAQPAASFPNWLRCSNPHLATAKLRFERLTN